MQAPLATAWLLAALLYGLGLLVGQAGGRPAEGRVLSGVEAVLLPEAGLVLRARLDTGAAISSLHAVDVAVLDPAPGDMPEQRGREVEFTVENEAGRRARLRARIEQVQRIRTGDCREYRYHVYVDVAHAGRSRRVLVNLNDRSYARERMLLGRNWLRQGYIVDVR